ncbi:DUF262 domain-containing protein [Devosia ginsengisoli]|uniref:HNH endonuclease family protein n=1 Tax=Devosia ginsengisoli TaxID=400770 RepID=UPI0026EB0A46|nr:DUF262 domain-containing protein [Devosia ginsengisoli]MCR6673117.1 DUF262 domain-containing protein [Devosia ginsengisoli]
MEISHRSVTVAELFEGYLDSGELGVRGFGGLLDIRPAYQREFVYDDKLKKAVIGTLRRNFPLNTMYWAVSGDAFELMDGQQRTISICQYVNGDFAVDIDGSPMFFTNLTAERQKQILEYKLSVYVCEGSDGDKLEWFRIINIAGLKLEPQELRNAIYTGPWLSDAKKWFSKNGAPAVAIGAKLLTGTPNRQAYLETALDWISKGHIEQYMAEHQRNPNANPLWTYFKNVIDWVDLTFPKHRKEMKGVSWGPLYDQFGNQPLDPVVLEARVSQLMSDNDVTKKSGIYDFVLSGRESALSIRAFDDNMKREAYETQAGICPACPPDRGPWALSEMEADHITPWSKNGKTTAENCQMLCKPHNRTKSGK